MYIICISFFNFKFLKKRYFIYKLRSCDIKTAPEGAVFYLHTIYS
nr:MAG TPA: hypothetical protein [Caudoviricetes sp.]